MLAKTDSYAQQGLSVLRDDLHKEIGQSLKMTWDTRVTWHRMFIKSHVFGKVVEKKKKK